MQNLAGRTAFITGGASGIGLGMATAFLMKRPAGCYRRHALPISADVKSATTRTSVRSL